MTGSVKDDAMAKFLPLLLLPILAACGGDPDPTPPPEDGASAAVVNASVNNAEQDLEAAEDRAEAQ